MTCDDVRLPALPFKRDWQAWLTLLFLFDCFKTWPMCYHKNLQNELESGTDQI